MLNQLIADTIFLSQTLQFGPMLKYSAHVVELDPTSERFI